MKSVLITGVAGGIGQACASYLTSKSWSVYGVDRVNPSGAAGFDSFWKGDVADEEFWLTCVLPEMKTRGPLKGLVNVAAIQPCQTISEMSVADWDEVMAVNLRAPFLAIRTLAPLMSKQNASIVNISSVHALATSPGMAAYVASKGGLVSFTKAAALELAPEQIRVNAILPGAVETKMLHSGMLRSADDSVGIEQLKATLAEKTPVGRIGTPGEIARAVEFLINEETSSFVTGQSLVIDGGATARLSTE